MKKAELEKECIKLKKLIDRRDILIKDLKYKIKTLSKNVYDVTKIIDENVLILKQHREFREFAEKAGSEKAKWKQRAIRAEEKIESMKNK